MHYTPYEEKDLFAMMLLVEGEGNFQVISCIEKDSKAGNRMLEVDLNVWDSNGKQKKVRDYIMIDDSVKLYYFSHACGLEVEYKNGTLKSEMYDGRCGKCVIGISPAGDRVDNRTGESKHYDAKNNIRKYKIKEKADPAPSKATIYDAPSSSVRAPTPPPLLDDDIPF